MCSNFTNELLSDPKNPLSESTYLLAQLPSFKSEKKIWILFSLNKKPHLLHNKLLSKEIHKPHVYIFLHLLNTF